MLKRFYLSLIGVLIVSSLSARNFTISGTISYAESGETMIAATILDTISNQGTITNAFGFYSLTLPEGPVSIRYSYVGCKTVYKTFELKENTTFNIQLKELTELEEVTVTATRNNLGVKGSQMSAVDVPVDQIKSIPALAGEVDVIKALQLLPGVQSGSEGSAGLYVRGGGPEENLILLDGVPLYNVNHLMGFFSVFNADAIKNVTLYKGNFPARFGSRLSSIVDVQQKEGNAKTYHGSLSLGLLTAKVNLEGPIIKDKTTFNISARRTFFDILAKPFLAMNKDEDTKDFNAGYYFYDLNAKVTHKFNDKDKLSFSYYMGDDVIYTKITTNDSRHSKTSQDLDWKWGNLVSTLNWYHIFTDKLFCNTTIAFTKYRFNIDMHFHEQYNDGHNTPEETNSQLDFNSAINDQSANFALNYIPNPNHDIKFGANYIYHTFNPSVATMKMKTNNENLTTKIGDRNNYTHEMALYLEDNWDITNNLKMNVGLRGAGYYVDQTFYPSLEPRISARMMLTDNLSAKASYSYMSQYVHLLSNSNISLPTDLWVPVTKNIKPMNSNQYAVGLAYAAPYQIELSLEGYYKDMNNVITYKEGSSFMGFSNSWEEKVNMGRGWSYGLEFLAQRKVGQLTGWLGYTWSKSQRQFDREGQEVNFGKPFYAKYDRRHDFSVTIAYEMSPRFNLSASYIYGTGTTGTLAIQKFQPVDDIDHIFNLGNHDIYTYPQEDNQSSVETQPLIEERNNFRMPDYHRLDIGCNFIIPREHSKHLFNISVYNVYNRHNAFMVYQATTNGGRSVLKQLSIFPIIPSFTYTYKF